MCQYLDIWTPVHRDSWKQPQWGQWQPKVPDSAHCRRYYMQSFLQKAPNVIRNGLGISSSTTPVNKKEHPSLTSVSEFLLQAKGPVILCGWEQSWTPNKKLASHKKTPISSSKSYNEINCICYSEMEKLYNEEYIYISPSRLGNNRHPSHIPMLSQWLSLEQILLELE